MDFYAIARMLGSLGVVLGLLMFALWAVRRFDLRLPGRAAASERRLAVVERIAVDQKRVLLLLRCDAREHLVLVGPEGTLLIQPGNGLGEK
ncbi:flagellar biosynthetic protein FliO [Iodidimonas sp. SYSU 1G8]|uniref:flagellar biosynthetic protein FliO n=1 Tax=Iodidimonas sp. SYSU 1G8 TaxID=3133967 RepID=UPI0031FE7606